MLNWIEDLQYLVQTEQCPDRDTIKREGDSNILNITYISIIILHDNNLSPFHALYLITFPTTQLAGWLAGCLQVSHFHTWAKCVLEWTPHPQKKKRGQMNIQTFIQEKAGHASAKRIIDTVIRLDCDIDIDFWIDRISWREIRVTIRMNGIMYIRSNFSRKAGSTGFCPDWVKWNLFSLFHFE